MDGSGGVVGVQSIITTMLRAFGSENQVMKYIKDVLGYTMYQMKNDQGVLVWDYECVYTNDKDWTGREKRESKK